MTGMHSAVRRRLGRTRLGRTVTAKTADQSHSSVRSTAARHQSAYPGATAEHRLWRGSRQLGRACLRAAGHIVERTNHCAALWAGVSTDAVRARRAHATWRISVVRPWPAPGNKVSVTGAPSFCSVSANARALSTRVVPM